MLNIDICFSRLEGILKVIRCKCKSGTDTACQKRCSCRKNGLFCVMACGQYQEEECSNESNSLIIDDINGCNDRNVFDAFASLWQIKKDCFIVSFISLIYQKRPWPLLYHMKSFVFNLIELNSIFRYNTPPKGDKFLPSAL